MEIASLFLLGALLGCSRSEPSAQVTLASKLRVEHIDSPAGSGSRCPRLSVGQNGRIYMSWLEAGAGFEASDTTLRFACFEGAKWGPAREIASGTRWFVNWADFPSLAVLDQRHLLAHFLQKSSDGTYDYHVQLARSADGGESWSDAVRLHSDAGAGEHGFVSLARRSNSAAAAVWLDGRNATSHDEKTGSMSLYARSIGGDGELGSEVLLDERVCDCCPTSAVALSDGAVLVAYRDRSPEEVRDITVVRLEDGHPSKSNWDSRDGWKIAGCPVNGPVLAARAELVALAWFTFGSDAQSRVLCAFSKDGGRSFGQAVTLAGKNAHGRVDAVFDAVGRLVITWLEADGTQAIWRVARVSAEAHVLDTNAVVVTTISRESGLARLAPQGSSILFTWTDTDPSPHVDVRRLTWE